MANEDQLCRLFANRMKDAPVFASWVLSHTKFAERGSGAKLLHDEQVWRRPNVNPDNWWRHWWCRLPWGEERETDIFVVFELSESKKRFALHIENKKDSKFSPGQAEGYRPRARHMMGKEKWLNYTDFETLLIAPLAFKKINKAKCDLFDSYLSYEDIRNFLPEFCHL